MITVTDIKQFIYCPRIIYFTYCMPLNIKQTFKMKHGKDEHRRSKNLSSRRTLQRYGLQKGKEKFEIDLDSQRLGISGKLDMLVINDQLYTPIELKYSTRRPGLNHKYQLIAYSLLVEEEYQTTINQGLIHLIPPKETFTIEITVQLKTEVKQVITQIIELIETERMPDSVAESNKCIDCEYRNFCGDI
ncbi:MAG: CRISPR-associated protein Cas4 [Bacillota bacterium]